MVVRCPFRHGDQVYLFAYAARCVAIRRQSSIKRSTSSGSNLRGLLPGPILTAGRYGFRLPEACWITHDLLTPSFFATSVARTSCRIGPVLSDLDGSGLPSAPMSRCMFTSRSIVWRSDPHCKRLRQVHQMTLPIQVFRQPLRGRPRSVRLTQLLRTGGFLESLLHSASG